jgi:hypothetical protein
MLVSSCKTHEYAYSLFVGKKVLFRDHHLDNDMADPVSRVEQHSTFDRGKNIAILPTLGTPFTNL